MSIIACSEEGVEALNGLVNAISEGVEQIQSETDALAGFADEYGDTLGPHQASLKGALEEIQSAINSSTTPASEVGEKLAGVAKKYQDIIGDDPFANSGN